MSTNSEPRLTAALRALRELVHSRRTAALATVDVDGAPFASFVPFALLPTGEVVLHISALAAHTQNLQRDARASLLVTAPEVAGEPVHALPRLTLLAGVDWPERGSADWQAAHDAYVARFPDAAFMTELGDFAFAVLRIQGARQVSGFGAARDVSAEDIRLALSA